LFGRKNEMTARIALITGAANGIGAATARRFVKDGYKVALIDLLESGQALADEFGADKALFIQGDVSQPDDVESGVAKAIKHFGGLEVLVNNAGVSLPKSLADTTTADWDHLHAINLRALYLGMKAAQAALAASGHGAVVNLASFHASATIGNFAAYAASKAGVLGLTRSAALELAPQGVRVNAVAPGVIHTAMTQLWLDSVPDPKAAMASMLEKQPLGRLGRSEEVAAAIAFLASDEASFITGTTLYVDGGVTARLWHA
jgi:NAD(P)-dependent dehydrogenase (short-subunit alcohol dehydrogenase family)